MNTYDAVPAALTLPLVAVADVAANSPGPTESEWSGLLMAALALAVREVLWWLRNRKRGEASSLELPRG